MVGGVGLGVFSAGAAHARTGRVTSVEEEVFRSLNQLPDRLYMPVWTVMQAGSLGAVAVSAAIAHRMGHPRQAVALALSGGALWAACKAIKPFVGRGRPEAHLDSVAVRGSAQTGLGYPSGHAAVAADLALVAAAGSAPGFGFGAAAVAAAVGFGRVYTGAHLPLDVIGGAALGAATGVVARYGLRVRGSAPAQRR